MRGHSFGHSSFFSFFSLLTLFSLSAFTQSIDQLSNAVRTGTSEQKRDALFQIRNLRSEEASRIALPALKDGNVMVRATAASAVAFLPKTEAVNSLAPLLKDKAEFVRRETAYALGTVGSRDASAPLLALLQKEKVYEVRTGAVSALGSTGDASAVTFLLSVLKTQPIENEDFLRRSAARSIGQIAQIIRTGNPYIVNPQNFLPEKYKDDISSDSAEPLTVQFPIFTPAVSELSRVLRDKSETDDTRREAAFALGVIGDPSAISVLESNLNSTDNYLAEICKEAILKIGLRNTAR
jgi:HEAT repeat protein